ncbi:hypothetical protein [Lentzea sp. NPDC059081]|uniref:hypothetical protein n=1 Tax=Lentzea sp. NPDC059081 TaxID=3346719 RepID=UPI00368E3324
MAGNGEILEVGVELAISETAMSTSTLLVRDCEWSLEEQQIMLLERFPELLDR